MRRPRPHRGCRAIGEKKIGMTWSIIKLITGNGLLRIKEGCGSNYRLSWTFGLYNSRTCTQQPDSYRFLTMTAHHSVLSTEPDCSSTESSHYVQMGERLRSGGGGLIIHVKRRGLLVCTPKCHFGVPGFIETGYSDTLFVVLLNPFRKWWNTDVSFSISCCIQFISNYF
jgi:hypothetical protein